MDCKEFLQMLDAFIDDELDAVQRKRMFDHAESCENCARELNTARELSRMLAEMDEDPVVPLAAQAAWRRAIKVESNKKRFNGFYRAVSGIAAAFVLMVGTTFVMRETGMLDRTVPTDAGVLYAEDQTYSGPARAFSLSAVTATAIESDGEVTETAAGARMIEGDAVQAAAETEAVAVSDELLARSAVREIRSENFAEDHAQIEALTDEYGGYLMSDSVSGEVGAQAAQIEAAVPAEDLDGFLAALDYIGTVTKAEMFTEDVTQNYSDAQGRLETLTAEKERLNELISAAKDSEELASLSAQLDKVFDEIDKTERASRRLQSDLSYARVKITLYEGDVAPGAENPGLWQQVKSFFADMVHSLVIIAPIVAVVIILAVGVMMIKRRRNRERNQ